MSEVARKGGGMLVVFGAFGFFDKNHNGAFLYPANEGVISIARANQAG